MDPPEAVEACVDDDGIAGVEVDHRRRAHVVETGDTCFGSEGQLVTAMGEATHDVAPGVVGRRTGHNRRVGPGRAYHHFDAGHRTSGVAEDDATDLRELGDLSDRSEGNPA